MRTCLDSCQKNSIVFDKISLFLYVYCLNLMQSYIEAQKLQTVGDYYKAVVASSFYSQCYVVNKYDFSDDFYINSSIYFAVCTLHTCICHYFIINSKFTFSIIIIQTAKIYVCKMIHTIVVAFVVKRLLFVLLCNVFQTYCF